MNRRLMIILICAFVVAGGASFVVYRLIGKQVGGANRRVNVVVAARDLQVGVLLKAADLKTGSIVGEAPKGAILKIESAVGRGVVSPVYTDEPLNEKRLAMPGSGGGLAATIPPGMRACAVKVDEVIGVAGFVVPGMRVDVLISGSPPNTDNTGGSKVKTLLQNIEVLSAGTNIERDAEGKPANVHVVNLLVSPEQAELLSLAANNQTHIQLALRNPLDHQEVKAPGVEMANLFGSASAKAAPTVKVAPRPVAAAPAAKIAKAEPPPPLVVEVINGAKTIEQKFEQKFPTQGERQ